MLHVRGDSDDVAAPGELVESALPGRLDHLDDAGAGTGQPRSSSRHPRSASGRRSRTRRDHRRSQPRALARHTRARGPGRCRPVPASPRRSARVRPWRERPARGRSRTPARRAGCWDPCDRAGTRSRPSPTALRPLPSSRPASFHSGMLARALAIASGQTSRQVVLQAQLHQQLSPLQRWCAGGQVLERHLQKGCRLGVRRRRDGLGRRGSCMGQGAYAVARGQGVVGQCWPGRVARAPRASRAVAGAVAVPHRAGSCSRRPDERARDETRCLPRVLARRVVSSSRRRSGQVDTDERQHAVVEPVRGARHELEDLEVIDLDLRDARQHRVPHRG